MPKKEWVRLIKFVMFSASAGIIQIGAFTLLNELSGWRYWPCYLISLILSILWNFTFNRRFTFKSNANITRAMLLVFAFYLVFTPLTTWMGDWLYQESGLFYWDAVVICKTKREAIKLGRINGQIAIFDLNEMQEIRL